MSNIILIIKLLLALKDLFLFLKGAIDLAQFTARMSANREAVKKAQEGSLEDRLKAGKDLENQSNDHAPKP